jgi:hypothetical protein
LLKIKIDLAEFVFQTKDGTRVIGLNRYFALLLDHPPARHDLLHNGLKEGLFLLPVELEDALQLFVREMMLGVTGFWREDC